MACPQKMLAGRLTTAPCRQRALAALRSTVAPTAHFTARIPQASVVSITTPRGTTTNPLFNYSGDAGSRHSWRNELTAGGTLQKLDLLRRLLTFRYFERRAK